MITLTPTLDSQNPWPMEHRTHAAICEVLRHAKYQAIVRSSPSDRDVEAVNPRIFLARLTSKHRRGCPSGWLRSKQILPRNPTLEAISLAKSAMAISRPEPILMGSEESRC